MSVNHMEGAVFPLIRIIVKHSVWQEDTFSKTDDFPQKED